MPTGCLFEARKDQGTSSGHNLPAILQSATNQRAEQQIGSDRRTRHHRAHTLVDNRSANRAKSGGERRRRSLVKGMAANPSRTPSLPPLPAEEAPSHPPRLEHCDEIVKGLYLGSVRAFQEELSTLTKHYDVHCVVRCLPADTDTTVKELEAARLHAEKYAVTLSLVPIYDNHQTNIFPHFLRQVEVIDNVLARGQSVLVHCQMGISRSASIVIAYLMWKKKVSLEEALTFAQERRSVVAPNVSFAKALTMWEEHLLGVKSDFDIGLYAVCKV